MRKHRKLSVGTSSLGIGLGDDRKGNDMKLTSAQADRACGVLVGAACGDALGAGYEFGSAPYQGWPAMIGGGLGGFARGEWTDDTAQTMAIAAVAATGADLRSDDALDAIAGGFADWFSGNPPDVGIQTAQILRQAGHADAATMATIATELHERTGRSAGNGSLMRTSPVALAHLDDPAALVEAAMKVSALTHHDPLAGEAAALWCLMIRHAVLAGSFLSAADAVDQLSAFVEPVGDWSAYLDEAETKAPTDFRNNGWAVGALQAAWSAIVHTPEPEVMPCRQLQVALATAIGIGNDTDTVASIAGALLGARWGVSAIPQEWAVQLHGWPGKRVADLVELALHTVAGGAVRGVWPGADRVDYREYGGGHVVAHPLVENVWIGDAVALDRLPDDIDAVVSLCRMGRKQVRDGPDVYVVRILDTEAGENPNIDFAIDDAARTVQRLAGEGKKVYLHCVAAQSRTPTVAARVGVLAGHPLDRALPAVVAALPGAHPRPFLVDALRRLSAQDGR